MTLESIVRPFQSPRPLGTRRVVTSSTKAPAQTAGVTWGAAGTLPTPRESEVAQPAPGISFNTEARQVTDHNIERSRETQTVKIEQEGNPDNFVMVERINKIAFNKRDPPTLQGKFPGSTTSFPAPGNQIGPHAFDAPVQISRSEYTINNIENAPA